MKYCVNCGKQIYDEAIICGFCGASQTGTSVSSGRFPSPLAGSAGGLSLSKLLLLGGAFVAFIASFFSALRITLDISMDALGLGNYYYGPEKMEYGISFLSLNFVGVMVLILAIAGIVCVIVDSFVKPLGLILPIAGAVQCVWFVAVLIDVLVQKGQVTKYLDDYMGIYTGYFDFNDYMSIRMPLGAGFWIYLIATLITAAGTVLIFSERRGGIRSV